MITILLLTGVALLTAAVALHVAWGQASPVRSADELLAALRPVDLKAFMNLVDPAEEAYLREALSPEDFRKIQRLRLRAAADYVSRTAYNAALLMRLGTAGRNHPDPKLARVAQDLMAGALQLRINAVLTLALLYTRMLAPGAALRLSQVLKSYHRTREDILRFSRLQAPTLVSRLEAAF